MLDAFNADSLVACHRCDTLVSLSKVSSNQKALCPCCNTVLHSPKNHTIDKTLAVSLAGLLLLLPAAIMPLMGIYAAGQYNQASLIACIAFLANNGFYFIAFCVFLFAIAVPAVRLFTAFYLTCCVKYQLQQPYLLIFFRSYHLLNHWAMIHVFFLGVIVSLYKLVDIADIAIGAGTTSLILLLICSTMLSITLDQRFLWNELEKING